VAEKQKVTGELAQSDPVRAVELHKMSGSGRDIRRD